MLDNLGGGISQVYMSNREIKTLKTARGAGDVVYKRTNGKAICTVAGFGHVRYMLYLC